MTGEESDVPEKRVAQRRRGYGEAPTVVVANGNAKWLMGIVAAMLGGILLGWYNDVRELRPDVAVLKVQMQELTNQVRVTNTRLETLTSAIVGETERQRSEGRGR
jgi:predicted membrane metal-binding protein